MHTLLVPERLSPEEAQARCDRYLASRWKGWRVARLFLPRERRADLIALAAWHELVRELMTSDERDIRQRDLNELVKSPFPGSVGH